MIFKIRKTTYEIEKDAHCWVLSKKTKSGKVNQTFHRDLPQLVESLVNRNIELPDVSKDLVSDLRTAVSDVVRLLSSATPKGIN